MAILGWLLTIIIVANVGIGLWKTKKWEDQNNLGQQDYEIKQKNDVHFFTWFKH